MLKSAVFLYDMLRLCVILVHSTFTTTRVQAIFRTLLQSKAEKKSGCSIEKQVSKQEEIFDYESWQVILVSLFWPNGFQDCSLEEIKALCWEQLGLISEKNLTHILSGKTDSQRWNFLLSRSVKEPLNVCVCFCVQGRKWRLKVWAETKKHPWTASKRGSRVPW